MGSAIDLNKIPLSQVFASYRPELSIEESLECHRKTMLLLENDNPWEEMSSKEKALCMNYKRQIFEKKEIARNMILAMDGIHKKYEGFHIGCVP